VPSVKKTPQPENFYRILSSRYPGLVEKIKRLIEDSEKAFAGNSPEADGSFLWEHTCHVASLAFRLAEEERRDPLLAAITALFHDAGKFAEGRYHEGDVPEEAVGARLAGPILKRSHLPEADRRTVTEALQSLYKDDADPHPLADIVHDADFLSKFGALGVAQFFIKSTLRGRTLHAALMNSLSKELTYAACLPLNMRTKAGRERAGQKAEETRRYYDSLIRELGEARALAFRIRTYRIPDPRRRGRTIDFKLVLTAVCDSCGGPWSTTRTLKRGLKCERLETKVLCRRCHAGHEIAFCLPELR